MRADFYVYDFNGLQGILDDYASVVWTGSFAEMGGCQIESPLTARNLAMLTENNIIVNMNPANAGIMGTAGIESRNVTEACMVVSVTVDEDAQSIKAKGLALDHWLTYRLVPRIVNYSSGADVFAKGRELLNAAFPLEDTARDFRTWLKSWSWSVKAKAIGSDFACSYKSLFETLSDLSATASDGMMDAGGEASCVGFRVFYERGEVTDQKAVLTPVAGRNLTGSGTKAGFTPVAFSDRFENVAGFSMDSSVEGFYNVALVAGEGEGAERTLVWAPSYDVQKYVLGRRELFVDARDMRRDEYASDAAYQAALRSRGVQKLVAQAKSYDFNVPEGSQYRYRRDFYLGDTVNLRMAGYNVSIDAQVTGAVESFGPNGYSCEVTFGNMRESFGKRLNKKISN